MEQSKINLWIDKPRNTNKYKHKETLKTKNHEQHKLLLKPGVNSGALEG